MKKSPTTELKANIVVPLSERQFAKLNKITPHVSAILEPSISKESLDLAIDRLYNTMSLSDLLTLLRSSIPFTSHVLLSSELKDFNRNGRSPNFTTYDNNMINTLEIIDTKNIARDITDNLSDDCFKDDIDSIDIDATIVKITNELKTINFVLNENVVIADNIIYVKTPQALMTLLPRTVNRNGYIVHYLKFFIEALLTGNKLNEDKSLKDISYYTNLYLNLL